MQSIAGCNFGVGPSGVIGDFHPQDEWGDRRVVPTAVGVAVDANLEVPVPRLRWLSLGAGAIFNYVTDEDGDADGGVSGFDLGPGVYYRPSRYFLFTASPHLFVGIEEHDVCSGIGGPGGTITCTWESRNYYGVGLLTRLGAFVTIPTAFDGQLYTSVGLMPRLVVATREEDSDAPFSHWAVMGALGFGFQDPRR